MCVYSQPRPPCQPKMMRMTNLVDVLFPSFSMCTSAHGGRIDLYSNKGVYMYIYPIQILSI